MKHLLGIILSLFAASALAEDAEVKWPDCYCTDKSGTRVELGQTLCMVVDGRSFVARCEMSLNNPMWREIGEECLSSQSSEPSLDAGLVHTQI